MSLRIPTALESSITDLIPWLCCGPFKNLLGVEKGEVLGESVASWSRPIQVRVTLFGKLLDVMMQNVSVLKRHTRSDTFAEV